MIIENMASKPQCVAVLDAGGQYVDMVRKAVERQGLPADVLPLDTPVNELEATYGAIIVSGSPASSHAERAPMTDPDLWTSDLPVLGICYGMQAMVVAGGGVVAKNIIREDGRITTRVNTAHPLFDGSKQDFSGLFTHGDFVTALPANFTAIGQHTLSDGSPAYSAVAYGNKVGVQFHPEVFDDTPGGHQLFGNFLHGIAALPIDSAFEEARLEHIISNKRQKIATQVANRPVIAFVSGGVDSSVAIALAAEVIPADKLHAYYIDNGFMRDEDDRVIEALQSAGIAVTKVDAVAQFENATMIIDGADAGPLSEVTDPEIKRRIIGKTFIDVQNDLLKKLQLDEALLLQGTNAADRIESGHSTGGHTMTIKTHHNQVQEVQDLKTRGLLIEPLDDLFKDEVRRLGHELGLPSELVERQPFPGPGLAIRIIATAKDQPHIEAAPEEAAIRDFLNKRSYATDRQINAHLLPIKSVGVGGDERSHISVVAIDNAGLSADQMAYLASDIPAHFRDVVGRVIYALGPLPLAKCSVTKTLLDASSRSQLRQADAIVFEVMRQQNLLAAIKQLPVVLLPLSFDASGDRSIVLRPVLTSTFMTAQAMLPERDLPASFFNTVTERILTEVAHISQVFLDLTNKPPGTTEWE